MGGAKKWHPEATVKRYAIGERRQEFKRQARLLFRHPDFGRLQHQDGDRKHDAFSAPELRCDGGQGEPNKEFKDKQLAIVLKDKQEKAVAEWKIKKAEKERKKAQEARMKQVMELRKQADERRKKAAEEAKKKAEDARKKAEELRKEREAKLKK